jgi:hypothetical protein
VSGVTADPQRVLLVGTVAIAVIGVGGCGDGTKHSSSAARETGTATATSAQPRRRKPSAPTRTRKARRVAVRIPRGWHVSANPVRGRHWPVPLKVAASFPIRRGSGNASCPARVLESMPPDGVYLMVAEFTKSRPKGVPPRGPLPPRGDLRHLDLRRAEVECWDGGLSGAKDFTENGRSYRVEVLLGSRVSPGRRRRALEALASLRLP